MSINLASLKELFSGRRFFVLALVVIVLLALGANFIFSGGQKPGGPLGRLTASPTPAPLPEPEITSDLPDNETPPALSGRGVSLEMWSALPSTVLVYRVATTLATENEESYWVRRFGFDGPGRDLGLGEKIWVTEQKLLRFDSRRLSVTYQNRAEPQSGSLTLANLSEKAFWYLAQAGLGKAEDFVLSRQTFFQTGPVMLSEVSRFEDADRVTFYLTPLVNGLPLVSAENITEPTQVSLDRAGNLIRLVHHLQNFTLGSPVSYPMKKPEVALLELEAGRGKVVSVQGLSIGVIPKLKLGQMQSVRLAYLYPVPGETLLQPVLVFTGQAADASGLSAQVTVMLWAVGN